MDQNTELKMFITTTDAACDECGEQLGRGAWVTLVENKGAVCLACADLDHLIFLPSGDAALTRRAQALDVVGSRFEVELCAKAV